MKFPLLFLFSFSVLAQSPPETEIFVFDIKSKNGVLYFENGANISQNAGYDNQPFFYSDNQLLFAKTRNNQTDIGGFDMENGEHFWVNNTAVGSEYSPQRIPGTRDVAAVRLDTTGLQLLYKYSWEKGESTVLLPNLKVGYFSFYDENLLLTAVLTENAMDLVLNDLSSKTSTILVKNTGRSLHKVPGSSSMSYTILNENGNFDVYLLDFTKENPESFFLCALPEGVQDYTWLDENKILLGKGYQIYLYDILYDRQWTAIADLKEHKLNNITRITTNEKGDKLAIAAEYNTRE
jgi:hypothetical protein